MTSVPNLQLSTGADTIDIPQLGFGVWQVPDAEAEPAIATALEVGYRSIDTAKLYGNEEGVGRALAATDLERQDLFVTTKVWNDDHGRDRTLAAFDASMERLGLDVLDLYLIHWPAPAQDRYVETWRALLDLRWHTQIGNVVIPKSVTPSRIRENFDIFGFELDADDLSDLVRLDRGERTGPDPVAFD